MKRILITTTALAVLGLALAVSRNVETKDSLTVSINSAFHDLAKATAPIPHEALHAKALEILRGRTIAKDESPSFADLERVENCVAFVKTTMEKVNCVKQ